VSVIVSVFLAVFLSFCLGHILKKYRFTVASDLMLVNNLKMVSIIFIFSVFF